MPAVGDIITGLVTYATNATIRAVGPIKTIFGARFFAQLRSPLNGQTYNAYFNLSDEYVTWVPGDQSGEHGNPLAPNVTTLTLDGVEMGTLQLSTYPVTGLVSYRAEAWVSSVGRWFDLVPASAPAQPLVVVDAPDGRQWVSRDTPNQQFLAATFWSVSTLHGSDEAVGWGMTETESDTHPLRTYHELNRRLLGWNQDNTCAGLPEISLSIHNLDDVSTLDTFAILTNLKQPNYEKYVRIRGTLNPVDGVATNRILTGYVPAVPATNTEREIIIAGLGTAPQYIGKIVQTIDGQRTSVVTRQNAPDRLSIEEVRDGAASLDGSGNTNVSDFAVGDHVSFFEPTKLADWPFPSYLNFPMLAQVRLTVGDGMFCDGRSAGSWPFLTQCLLGSGVADTTEFYLTGGTPSLISCGIFANHANSFVDVVMIWTSCAVLVAGDGPFLGNTSLLLADETIFVPIGGGGVGIRTFGSSPCSVTVADVSSIASFGMSAAVISLMSTHVGQPGDFTGSDSTESHSKWYGSGNTGLLLVLGKNTRSKFPKIGATVTTSNTYAINIAGKGPGDTNPLYNRNFSDIPIVIDDGSLSTLADSTPNSF